MKIVLRHAIREDNELMRSLLKETNLPTEGLDGNAAAFFVAEDNGEVVAIAGFEFYGGDVLLRSVAVRPGSQRRGFGSRVVDLMLDEARKKGVQSVVLLTETARDFFLKKGFNVVERSSIHNAALKGSSEFTYACPKSAVCMRLWLKQESEAMIEKVNANNAKAGYSNVEFRLGEIENMPVESESVDVVLSNCVLNLVPDKERAFEEIMRVLKPSGHFSISDIVTTGALPGKLREVAALYGGCVSGALTEQEYLAVIAKAGFRDIVVKNERQITVPDSIIEEVGPADFETLKSSGAVLLSITVRGSKP